MFVWPRNIEIVWHAHTHTKGERELGDHFRMYMSVISCHDGGPVEAPTRDPDHPRLECCSRIQSFVALISISSYQERPVGKVWNDSAGDGVLCV